MLPTDQLKGSDPISFTVFGYRAHSVHCEQLMNRFQKKAEGIDSKWQDVPNIFELSKHSGILTNELI